LLLHEVPPLLFWPALLLMIFGVWLHLTEHHSHDHFHEVLDTSISIVTTSTIHTTIWRPIHQESRILIGIGTSQ
jgi:hypothetical protein